MKPNAILVLGNGISDTGTLSQGSVARLQRGLEIIQEYPETPMVLSGGASWHLSSAPAVSEAQAMAIMAESLGIPCQRILLEEMSKDTLGNIFFCKCLYVIPNAWRSVVIVTSMHHAERVKFLSQKIFGTFCTFHVDTVKSEVTDDLIQSEQEKMDFLRDNWANVQDGDDHQICQMIFAHPGYQDDQKVCEWLMATVH